MEKKKFTAPYDNLVKIISNIGVIISLLVLFNIFHTGLNSNTMGLGLIVPIVLSAWLFHPLGYVLDEECLHIRRPIGNLRIPYKDIENIGYISKEELGNCARLFACGGLFGYFGTYISNKFGKINMWCTNKDGMIFIIQNDEKITLISPSDSDLFIALMNDNL